MSTVAQGYLAELETLDIDSRIKDILTRDDKRSPIADKNVAQLGKTLLEKGFDYDAFVALMDQLGNPSLIDLKDIYAVRNAVSRATTTEVTSKPESSASEAELEVPVAIETPAPPKPTPATKSPVLSRARKTVEVVAVPTPEPEPEPESVLNAIEPVVEPVIEPVLDLLEPESTAVVELASEPVLELEPELVIEPETEPALVIEPELALDELPPFPAAETPAIDESRTEKPRGARRGGTVVSNVETNVVLPLLKKIKELETELLQTRRERDEAVAAGSRLSSSTLKALQEYGISVE